MSRHASGRFEVHLRPAAPAETADGVTLGRMEGDKRYFGDLDATARIEMLSARTDVAGSAGYVAIERVVGALHGRSGSFVLQHSGLMSRGASRLELTVVPDSGTGELAGLSGQMRIEIAEGVHHYRFDFDLPTA